MAVNDRLGHAAGDELLATVADRLRSMVRRPGDTTVRLGRDEFTILLDPALDEADATVVAQRVITAIQKPVILGDTTAHVGCSVGIAYGVQGVNAEQLLVDADTAMYEAKSSGKGCCRIARPAQQTV